MCRKKYETIISVFPSEVSSYSTQDMGIIDILSGLFAVKHLVKLWREMATDLISFFFLRSKPFSTWFPYTFKLLDFFFNTEYYAILMSNSFTLVHFCTLYNSLIHWFISNNTSDNNDSNPSFHEEQLPTIAAHSGFGWNFFFFFTHQQALHEWKLLRQKKPTTTKTTTTVKTIKIYLC